MFISGEAMEWVTIKAPKKLCLYDIDEKATLETYAFLSQLDRLPNDNYVKLDLSDVKKVTAAAVLYLFANVISKQLYISNNFYSVILPKNTDVQSQFECTGLQTALKQGGTKKIERMWCDKNSNFLCGNNKNISGFLGKIRKLTGLSTLPQNLGTALKETFLNINHHAYNGPTNLVDVTWFSYFDQGEDDKGKYITALIADRGRGIPQTIKQTFPDFNNKRDCFCIEHAMLAGVTSTLEDGRGEGSVNIQRPVELAKQGQKDSLLLLSGKGHFFLEKQKNTLPLTLKEMDYSLFGSIIEWRLYY